MKKEDFSYSQDKLVGKRPYAQTDCANNNKNLSQIEEQDDERII